MGACCSKAAAVQPLDNFDELVRLLLRHPLSACEHAAWSARVCTQRDKQRHKTHRAAEKAASELPSILGADCCCCCCCVLLHTKLLQGLQAADDVTSCPAATASAVKVVVLVRPLLPLEEQQGATSIVSITGPDKVWRMGRRNACGAS